MCEPAAADLYRIVEEPRIAEMVVLYGWPKLAAAGDLDSALGLARAAIATWVSLGLPYRLAAGGERLFDPVEVIAFFKRAGRAGRDPFWADRLVRSGRDAIHGFAPAPDHDAPPDVAALPPRRFRVRISRTFGLDGVAPGQRLRLRLPRPIQDASLDDLTVRDATPGLHPSETASQPLEWRTPAPDAASITVAASYDFTARPARPDARTMLEAADRELYTRPVEGLVRTTPRIEALAQRLEREGDDDMAVLRRVYDHLIDGFADHPQHYDQAPVDDPLGWVLDRAECDCQLGSALLVALCRRLGLPSRLCEGYVLYAEAPSQHYWSETFIQGAGWTPVDLMSGDLSAAGTQAAWRECLFGVLDYRMKTESLPRHFTGQSSVRLPARWVMLPRPRPGGLVLSFLSVPDGRLVYEDEVRASPL